MKNKILITIIVALLIMTSYCAHAGMYVQKLSDDFSPPGGYVVKMEVVIEFGGANGNVWAVKVGGNGYSFLPWSSSATYSAEFSGTRQKIQGVINFLNGNGDSLSQTYTIDIPALDPYDTVWSPLIKWGVAGDIYKDPGVLGSGTMTGVSPFTIGYDGLSPQLYEPPGGADAWTSYLSGTLTGGTLGDPDSAGLNAEFAGGQAIPELPPYAMQMMALLLGGGFGWSRKKSRK